MQDKNSNFFQRKTKLIIATQNLSNDFSTSAIHAKGNVAIVSLSSADKKGGSYTFKNQISMQEFSDIKPQLVCLENNDNKYNTQVAESKYGLYIVDIIAYSDKEQQNSTTTIDENKIIFVQAKLNDNNKVFYDESIKWAYCLKNRNENLDKINIKERYKKLIAEGNDIAFSLNMLKNDDKQILLNSRQFNLSQYELILFAYFKAPAIKVRNNKTSIILSLK